MELSARGLRRINPHRIGVVGLFDCGDAMTSPVRYGLNAINAAVLLIVGWYLPVWRSGSCRLLIVTHRIDALVTVFAASFARYAVLVVVGIAALQSFGVWVSPASTGIRRAWQPLR
jgi:hypothetical protein